LKCKIVSVYVNKQNWEIGKVVMLFKFITLR